mgnify:CR=1 FL=1
MFRMHAFSEKTLPWIAATAALAVAGCLLIGQRALTQMRDAFDTDARIMHRLLSQRAVQHDAILATLGLLQSPTDSDDRERRLSSVYPQVLLAAKRSNEAQWPLAGSATSLATAEAASRAKARPVLAVVDYTKGQFWMVQASSTLSHALLIDMQSMVPWSEWPTAINGAGDRDSAVRVALAIGTNEWVLQPGKLQGSPWKFEFHKHLATESQPFDVVVTRCVRWSEMPWLLMFGWCALSIALMIGLATILRQRRARVRAEELLRLGQVARLNSLGELAAGMAHELNQPLTAVLANTQAAARLLKDDPPDIATAQPAMQRAADQARRAADVLSRLRQSVAQPNRALPLQSTSLEAAVRNALYLLEPQLRALRIQTEIVATHSAKVMADATALEQVIHNVLTNASNALQTVPAANRRIRLTISVNTTRGELAIVDSGPGIPADVLPRVFEPFFTTRASGDTPSDALGLGLSICESLMENMGGRIRAENARAGENELHGAMFTLSLPLAAAPTKDGA